MGEVPEDVRKLARKIAFADGGEPGCHIEYMVAEALLAERKRCAEVCRSIDLFDGDKLKNSDPRITIADAILNQ